MQNKTKKLTLINSRDFFATLTLSAVVLFLPQLIPHQWIVGPIINAVFVISLFLFGIRPTIILCFVPSMIAMLSGILPSVMAPILPFIMLSNVIYVTTIFLLTTKAKNSTSAYWYGIFTASFLKFLFLVTSINLLGKLLTGLVIPTKILTMFSWPQLLTAITGGIIASIGIRFFNNGNIMANNRDM